MQSAGQDNNLFSYETLNVQMEEPILRLLDLIKEVNTLSTFMNHDIYTTFTEVLKWMNNIYDCCEFNDICHVCSQEYHHVKAQIELIRWLQWMSLNSLY